ncbi:predicted protein [Botrytis cinerea T4]|uniref:Uncharacterized protein n=1 Tax=Botryotinia fuckeliana (strain T4) TaxID=999810 RepID=G2Y958_BOTF4|nr:predicted protein [Botrytis cinerea T4]
MAKTATVYHDMVDWQGTLTVMLRHQFHLRWSQFHQCSSPRLNRFRTAGSGIGVFGTLRNIEVPDNTAAYAGSPGCLPSLKPPATSLEAKAQ